MKKRIAFIASLCFAVVYPALAEDTSMAWPPKFTHSRIAVTDNGWHSTTRGTIRLVFPHEGQWLVFRGDPNTYHFSADALTWTSTEAPQAGRSHLIDGDTIYTRYNVLVDPAPNWVYEKFICRGTIANQQILWDEPIQLNTKVDYYPDLKQDTNGYFTMTGRAALRDEQGNHAGTQVLWTRSKRPNDISEWEPDTPFVHQKGDGPIEGDRDSWKKIGSTAHENLVLDDGQSYAFGMLTVDRQGKLYGNLHDGQKWNEEATELATGMSTWAGTDRRLCAVFDKAARIMHLAYVDGAGQLWYRRATAPYAPSNWSEPLQLQPFKTFTVVLSLDTSQTPAHLYVLFGKTLLEDKKDLRNTLGSLHLQQLDGETWGEPILVSEPGTQDNWYPNMNADLKHGIGVLYLKGGHGTRQPVDGKIPLDIMFASTGTPR